MRYHEGKCSVESYMSMNSRPFIRKTKELGWTLIQEESRAFLKGEFNQEVFVKIYNLMRHDVGIMREKKPKNRI
ncbi:hypothetical protein COL83_26975 [Bacillus wiedmannii]|nr:hypothetical protein COL83_26975 [Bacillus wiedmannii]